jgi:dTDP-4-amino-4,6-dideoxygalactose transaminase
LSERGVGAAILYPVPIHLQPAYADNPPLHLPVTEKFASELLCLPMYPELSEGEVNAVCEGVRECVKNL